MFEFRQYKPEDKNFVITSWCESFRRSHYSGTMSDNLYFDSMRAHLEDLITRPGTQVLLCTAPQESPPNDILGFACYATGVLHFLYVKHLFRGNGVARALLKRTGLEAGGVYTHKTKASIDYAKAHNGWQFDPKVSRYGAAKPRRVAVPKTSPKPD